MPNISSDALKSEVIVCRPSDRLCCLVWLPHHPTEIPSCIVLTSSKSSFILNGKATFTNLHGPPVNVLGASLYSNSEQSFHLFSPTTHSPVTFSRSDQGVIYSDFTQEKLASALLGKLQPDTISSIWTSIDVQIKNLSGVPSVLFFEFLNCRILSSVTKVKRFKSLFVVDSENSFPTDSKLTSILGFSFVECDISCGFRVSPIMCDLSSQFTSMVSTKCNPSADLGYQNTHFICPSPILMIAGPKGAGKSSLLRFVVNRFLTHTDWSLHGNSSAVAVLDCDIGQPEFTPSGMVSLVIVRRPLFGPPFTHLILNEVEVVRRCFVGCLTPSNNPTFYLDCLHYVFDAYTNLPEPKPPLVVNTMGWTQGLGLTLLVEQIVLTKPHLIGQMQVSPDQPGSRQNLPLMNSETLRSLQGWAARNLSDEEFNHQVVIIPSMSHSPRHSANDNMRKSFGAPDHRDLTFLTYFTSSLAKARTSLPALDSMAPLGHPVAHFLDCLPYRVPLKLFGNEENSDPLASELTSFQMAVCLLRSHSKMFPASNNLPALTIDTTMACLNATLVALCAVPSDLIEQSPCDPLLKTVPVNPVCECLGLAICRAIDSTRGIIYLTTGLSENELLKVTAIVRGSVDLPFCFFLEQPIPYRPYPGSEIVQLPYMAPSETQGLGRSGLPARRSYPRTSHHDVHRIGSSENFEDSR